MKAFKALELPLDRDLAGFSRLLWQRGVPHRIVEDKGRQVLVVADESQIERVREDYRRYESGELVPQSAPGRVALPEAGPAPSFGRLLRLYPLTLGAIAFSLAGFALVYLDHRFVVLHWLSFTDFHAERGRLVFEPVAGTYARGEYWRLLTPVFLHFSLLHITFNMLWYWEFGRRIELQHGSLSAAALLLITGAGGNIAQFIFAGSVMFGGMSGVIYGLLGYMWAWNRFSAGPPLPLRPGILAFMLVWLLVCMSGFVEAMGFGAVANAAHGAGLALGALMGVGAALLNTGSRRTP